MIGQTDDLAILKTLTSTLNDSVNGYREAAKDVESDQFRDLFSDFAEKRSRASADIEAEVRRLGGEPDQDGTALGGIHQAWLDIKAAVTGRDDKAVINEVERGEDFIKGKYEAALKDEELPQNVRQVVSQAYDSIRADHDEISAMKHSLQ